jgi:hypothetical protein
MTIKNRGGVFGRNPTFNNVEVEGTLTTTGSLSFPADSISGNAINGGTPTTAGLIVDTTTLVVDAENNRVGVGTATPSGVLAATDGSSSLIVGQATDNFHAANAHRFYTLSFGAEPVRIDSDGVKFNGDTAAANALSDYEEGTWSVTGHNLTITGAPTYTGHYTKIGRIVHVTMRIQATSISSTGGATFINGGFPFVSAAIFTTAPFANSANGNSLGVGLFYLSGGSTIIYTPTFSSIADIAFTGHYYV